MHDTRIRANDYTVLTKVSRELPHFAGKAVACMFLILKKYRNSRHMGALRSMRLKVCPRQALGSTLYMTFMTQSQKDIADKRGQ